MIKTNLTPTNLYISEAEFNNLVSAADNKLIIVQDLEGYLVNDTKDVLVICKKDEDDDFKKFRNNVLLKYGEGFM